MPGYDVIVAGLGGIGSATAYHLAKSGARTLGLDMHPRGHTFGSSHGHHRIIREAYFEDPEYVPLVQRAYELWHELEEASGQHGILNITGGMVFGRPDNEVVVGALKSAEIHNLPAERLTAADVMERFPGFRLPDSLIGVYESRAGYVQPERAVAAHSDLAAGLGAELHYDREVLRWSADADGVEVETTAGTYRADRLMITTGPWASELLDDLDLPLTVRRIVNAHFQPARPDLFDESRFPIFVFDDDNGRYYGFPFVPGLGVKIGLHDGEVTTPRTIRREIDDAEIEQLRLALDTYLPGSTGEVLETLTCMYTMTPDEHFIVDRHPEQERVIIGCGFSGHGFKFASVLGELLARLARDEDPGYNLDFISARRQALST